MEHDHDHPPPDETAERHIWLVRHAEAADPVADGDDAARPLVPKGIGQARALAKALRAWGVRPDVVLSSPRLRAAETAAALGGRSVRTVDALAMPDAAATSAAIVATLAPDETTVVVVGHEPWLSALASWWLCGDEAGAKIAFRKAAAMALTGAPGPGAMTLEGFVPIRWVKRLRRG